MRFGGQEESILKGSMMEQTCGLDANPQAMVLVINYLLNYLNLWMKRMRAPCSKRICQAKHNKYARTFRTFEPESQPLV